LVVRTKIQYHLDKPFVAVETDRSNPDVAGYIKGYVSTVLTENEKQAMEQIESLKMAMEKPVMSSWQLNLIACLTGLRE